MHKGWVVLTVVAELRACRVQVTARQLLGAFILAKQPGNGVAWVLKVGGVNALPILFQVLLN